MVELENLRFGTELIKRGFAKMQKGGVIMDVTTLEQAKIAEDAGAVAVMALERVPADIRAEGGVARMADPRLIEEIIDKVSIPVMAKCRIGHFVEAQILEAIGADMVDESEVLTPADPFYHVDKHEFKVPFVCGCRGLGEALRRIWEGAAMIRTKGEAGTGNVVEAVRHVRTLNSEIHALATLDETGLKKIAKEYFEPLEAFPSLSSRSSIEKAESEFYELIIETKNLQRLPVVNFAAGGIATPADAAMMMQLGSDGVFVGSGIFKSEKPEQIAKAVVQAVENYSDPEILSKVSGGLGTPMHGIEMETLKEEDLLQTRGH